MVSALDHRRHDGSRARSEARHRSRARHSSARSGESEALAIAHASGADFVRVEGFVYAHVADEGVIESCAGDLLRYRRAIGAERVLIFADIKKKHSAHAITADVSIVETAKAAEFFLADGVIVTGAATGEPASPDEVRDVVQPCACRCSWDPALRRRTWHVRDGPRVRGFIGQTGWRLVQPAGSRRRAALAGAFVELSPDR